jgi:hypothetical protein
MKKIAKLITKYSILTCFGIAMGYLEAVVVVYIRKILSLEGVVDLTKMVVSQIPEYLINMEITREASTIVMLVTLSLLIEQNKWMRLSIFLWVFAVWDIFYYVSLKILINWPPSLSTVDCLFLIPIPWIAPVWIPFLVMPIFLIISIWIRIKRT